MSGLDLDPIKERLAAATPGPLGFSTAPAEGSSESPAEYVANAFTGYGEMYVVWDTSTEGNPEGYVLTAVTGDGPRASANAELYANAPSDLAALVAEVERLRATVIVEQNRRQPWVKLAHQNAQEVKRLREQIDAVRAATANHPDPCEKHPDGDTVTCGWKSAYQDVVHALEVMPNV